MLILGVFISVVGIVNIKGNISTIHSYNRRKVKEEDIPKYGKTVCTGTLIIGISLVLGFIVSFWSEIIIDYIILDDNISITDFDICRIFINLLDNSINALKNYNDNDKIIFISCKKDNNNIYIKCENKFSENNKKFKKNSELHGYGLKIVKDIAQKYDGDLIIDIQDSTYKTLVVLKTE